MDFFQIVNCIKKEFEELSEMLIVDENSSPNAVLLPAESLCPVCKFLYSDNRLYFDMLSCITGIDHVLKEQIFEVAYNIYSIPFEHHLMIKVKVNRDSARIPTLQHIWKTANWLEREVYDMFGIEFLNHPDLRRILLPADWVGFPLRKDYKQEKTYRNISIAYEENEKEEYITNENPRIKYKTNPNNLNLSEPTKYHSKDLKAEELLINLGPQHPSTHGVLRLEILTDNEIIKDVVPHIGYLHRCFEKHAESLPYNQIIPFVDRMDYLAAMNSEHVYAMGIEKMLGINHQLPKRIEYIRVLVSELNRIASHFVAIGTYAMDIGSFTPFFWMMRDREHIMRMLEWVTGARMLYNYIWIGGLYYDLPIGFESKCLEFISYIEPKLKELEVLVTNNKIFIERTANVGVLPLELAINYGITGPMLRGSGLRYDLRRVDNYSVYPELDFNIPIGEGIMGTVGDCWDRTYVRMIEIKESLKIIKQCVKKLNTDYKRSIDFDPHKMVPKKIRPKEQDLYFRAENPKGELGFYFKSDGESDIPIRCKVRSCCFVNLSIIDELAKGSMIADLVAILGSIDIVLGEVDR